MVTPVLTHTAHLGADELAEIRALCELVFPRYGDHTWQHALGGMHARISQGGVLVAHASLVQRRLGIGDRWLRCGWIESVAVHPDHQRHGLGDVVMKSLEELAPGYEVLGLCSSGRALRFYESRGWTRWHGASFSLTPDGVRPTPDEDTIFVLAGPEALDADGPITCDWREGEVW